MNFLARQSIRTRVLYLICSDRTFGTGIWEIKNARRLDARRAKGTGDLSSLLDAHLAEFVGTELGLHDVRRSRERKEYETENCGDQEHGSLLSECHNVESLKKMHRLTGM